MRCLKLQWNRRIAQSPKWPESLRIFAPGPGNTVVYAYTLGIIHFSKMIKDRVDWVSGPMECVRDEKQKNYSKRYIPT